MQYLLLCSLPSKSSFTPFHAISARLFPLHTAFHAIHAPLLPLYTVFLYYLPCNTCSFAPSPHSLSLLPSIQYTLLCSLTTQSFCSSHVVFSLLPPHTLRSYAFFHVHLHEKKIIFHLLSIFPLNLPSCTVFFTPFPRSLLLLPTHTIFVYSLPT
jgi:hypothetical protein